MCTAQRQTQAIPTGPTAQIEAASWTRQRLAAFDVPLPGGNRLERAKALIEDVNERRVVLAADNSALLDQVNEAQWTIIEQYIIGRSLGRPGRQLDPVHLRKLEEMLSGADVVGADRNPLARNTQFELYVAAYLTMGDVRVRIAEPDLEMDYLGVRCGVAAKRVQSVLQATRRAREAADQIASSGIRGFVAVNVDVLLARIDEGPDPETTLEERLQIVNEVEAEMAQREQMIGTITFGRDAIWDFRGERPSVQLSHSIRNAIHPRYEHDERVGREFFDRVFARVDERLGTL